MGTSSSSDSRQKLLPVFQLESLDAATRETAVRLISVQDLVQASAAMDALHEYARMLLSMQGMEGEVEVTLSLRNCHRT